MPKLSVVCHCVPLLFPVIITGHYGYANFLRLISVKNNTPITVPTNRNSYTVVRQHC